MRRNATLQTDVTSSCAHVAHEALEENQLGLQLLHSESQLVLAALALLQVLQRMKMHEDTWQQQTQI